MKNYMNEFAIGLFILLALGAVAIVLILKGY